MRCLGCGLDQPAGNRICEDCGARMPAASTAAADAPCPQCGAGSDAADADGFCSRCGYERPRPAASRVEATAGAHLAGVSDPGPVRDHNEDFLALACEAAGDVLVVCDGVSNSQNPGQAASAAAVACRDALRAALVAGGSLGLAAMKTAVAAAETAVAGVPHRPEAPEPPPETTLVAAVRRGREVILGWVGDSRADYVGAGGARLLTQDHSWVNEVVAAGQMSHAEARKSSLAHAVTRTVGGPRHAGPPADEPSLRAFEAPDGPGWLLLCSDGFWGCAAEPERLAELVRRRRAGTDALALARELVDFARDSRGHDNITVVALALGVGRGGGPI